MTSSEMLLIHEWYGIYSRNGSPVAMHHRAERQQRLLHHVWVWVRQQAHKCSQSALQGWVGPSGRQCVRVCTPAKVGERSSAVESAYELHTPSYLVLRGDEAHAAHAPRTRTEQGAHRHPLGRALRPKSHALPP